MPRPEAPPVEPLQSPNQAATNEQPTLMERAVNRTVDIATNPYVLARTVAIGHDTLQGMGITTVGRDGSRHLNVETAIGHLQSPRPAIKKFAKEFGKAAAGEAAAHAGTRAVGHIFERADTKRN